MADPLDDIQTNSPDLAVTPPIPDDSNLPITSNAPPQSPTGAAMARMQSGQKAQAQNRPPVPMPILAQLISGMIKPPQGPPDAMGVQRPGSRVGVFENFLGNFITALGSGLAAAHGPGAFGKGFGAAASAPYEQDVRRFQLGQQAQANQAEIQQRQAQTELTQKQSQLAGTMVTLPNGWTVPMQLAQKLAPTLFSNQTKEDIADKKIASNEDIAKLHSTDRATALQAKLGMFRQTQQFQTWKAKLDNQTRMNVARLTAGKAPAAMMQTATFAQSGINRLDDAQAAFDDLTKRGVLGSVTSDKLEDWIFGKGLIDPTLPAQDRQEIGKLRSALSYTSSAAMRAHTGRTSKEIYADFKNTLGLNQGEDALRGSFEETRKMLGDYASSASDASVQALRSGFPQQAQPNQPKGQPSGRRIIDLTK